ncbi:unnamed protein product (mitochondrion) [Plasmodiophora brassicae]|uniref:Folate receptor-like domain-containing protein n=1 Tax=Plasmodiophora brassicae TaxID=37360 RepID=A0A3P3YLF0_PLABS|nr:unnamed protein product [Plasmodiophora brassicae]
MTSLIVAVLLAVVTDGWPDAVHCNAPGPRFLKYCDAYADATCCSRQDDQRALRRAAPLYTGQFSARCKEITAQMACSVCDPRVGMKKVDAVCQSRCDDWYESCKNDFFTTPASTSAVLEPCSVSSLVCSRLSDIVTSGEEFCSRSGYSVATSSSTACFDGTPPKRRPRVVVPATSAPTKAQIIGAIGVISAFVAVIATICMIERRSRQMFEAQQRHLQEERRRLLTESWEARLRENPIIGDVSKSPENAPLNASAQVDAAAALGPTAAPDDDWVIAERVPGHESDADHTVTASHAEQ